MKYKLGDTFITVEVKHDKEEISGEYIWRCVASIGQERLIEITSPRSRYDTVENVEFDFMRIVAYELTKSASTILWGTHEVEE